MTECEEVARAMLPRFLAERDAAHNQGRMFMRPQDYVMRELRATESYTVIDNVSAALVALVYPPRNPQESP
jgi:hypothetical protein